MELTGRGLRIYKMVGTEKSPHITRMTQLRRTASKILLLLSQKLILLVEVSLAAITPVSDILYLLSLVLEGSILWYRVLPTFLF